MITITKEFSFEAAHMLSDHGGLCKNVHGHSYKVQVTVSSNDGELLKEGPSKGMVIDFGHLKALLQEKLFNKLDHAFIYDEESTSYQELKIVEILRQFYLKLFPLPGVPTSETMCIYFAEKISSFLPKTLTLQKVTVWETATSFATWQYEPIYEKIGE